MSMSASNVFQPSTSRLQRKASMIHACVSISSAVGKPRLHDPSCIEGLLLGIATHQKHELVERRGMQLLLRMVTDPDNTLEAKAQALQLWNVVSEPVLPALLPD